MTAARLFPAPSPIKYTALGAAVSVTGTASETVLGTVTIPGGSMGPNGIIRLWSLWSYTNSANNKTLRIRLGGIGGTAFAQTVFTTTASVAHELYIKNINSQSAQKGFIVNAFNVGPYGSSATALTSGTIDTSADTTLVMTGTLANTGETITLEAYFAEVFRLT